MYPMGLATKAKYVFHVPNTSSFSGVVVPLRLLCTCISSASATLIKPVTSVLHIPATPNVLATIPRKSYTWAIKKLQQERQQEQQQRPQQQLQLQLQLQLQRRQEQQQQQQKASKKDEKKDPKKAPNKEQNQEPSHELNGGPSKDPKAEQKVTRKLKKKPRSVTIVEYEISCDEMGITIPPKPYLPRITCGAVMDRMHMYPNYIDQEHLVSNCDPEPWDLVPKLSLMDQGVNCIRELSQAVARLRRTGEEDGIYVEIDRDEWVSLDTDGNDVEPEDEADPDEEEYVLL
ncbi:hypothetical protein DFP73DRAFT_586973 [Morchella snyderi]|nr:hypothetical protein DFP73DRAFT_586973 [Morchella snyderi]